MGVALLFKEVMKTDLDRVGFKGLSISILANEDFNVPPGFIIPSEAFGIFIKEAKIEDKIQKLLLGLNENNIKEVSTKIKRLIEETDIPVKLKDELVEAYESLGFELNHLKITDLLSIKEDSLIAVRSSYIEKIEDSEVSQPTLLNVKGKINLLKAIKQCWSSLYDEPVLLYKLNKKLSFDSSTAIVIQKMINAECSGLSYSSNPESKLKSEILIKACFGYGNVLDKVVPDSYIVNKKDLSIKDIRVNEQEFALVRDSALGEDKKRYLREKGKKQKIDDKLIREIARVTKRVSEILRREYMLEWCVYKDRVYTLQAKELEMDFEDEKKEAKEEIKEEFPKEEPEKETVDIKEPELEEDLAALEEIETEDIDLSGYEPELSKKTEIIEPEKTNEIIKEKEIKRDKKDFFDYVHKVEDSLTEKPEVTFKIDEEIKEDRIPTIDEIEEIEDEKPIFEEQETKKGAAHFDLIKELTQKMELQLEEKDVDGYKETMEKLKRILEGV